MIIEVKAKVSPQRESLFEGKFEVLVDRWAQTWNIINSHFLCTDWPFYRLYDDLHALVTCKIPAHFCTTLHCREYPLPCQTYRFLSWQLSPITFGIGHRWLGKPLFEMCCFHMGIAHQGGVVKACQDSLGHLFPTLPGGVRACQDGLRHFFYTFACLTEGGGSKAIWAMHI